MPGAGASDMIMVEVAVNSKEHRELIMAQFQIAAQATIDLQATLVLKLSIPHGEIPAVMKIIKKKDKLDEHVEKWTRRI